MSVRLRLHGAIYRPDSFVLVQRYCVNLKAIRYESTILNRIVVDESHRVIVALIHLKKLQIKSGKRSLTLGRPFHRLVLV